MRRSSRITRQSVSASVNGVAEVDSKISIEEKENEEVIRSSKPRRARTKKRTAQSLSDASGSDVEEYVEPEPSTEKPRVKRRKVAARSGGKSGNANAELYARLFGKLDAGLKYSGSSSTCTSLPNRTHDLRYHRPLLLDSRQSRTSLLTWFDGVSSARKMPWRKPWIDPTTASGATEAEVEADLRSHLERRAYEVWISEIMLQQTRVAAVIDYWDRWMQRWPSIQELAQAEPDDVLAAWRGLGYYSRATRIHDAARIVCADEGLRGLLPDRVEELVKKVPGVGRYTAGAIAAIVFGRAAPMVDGNVLRVLSRQMGVLGDVKTDKGVVDTLWEAADRLVRAIARDGSGGGSSDEDGNIEGEESEKEEEPSDRPGRWGQALMELGSTVCTPKPNCAACPITSSCRAYGEGLQLAAKKGLAPKSTAQNAAADIEDACSLCKPFDEYADEDGDEQDAKADETPKQQKAKTRVQATLQSFAFTQTSTATKNTAKSKKIVKQETTALGPAAVDVIANHARKFPIRTVKKAVREEETLVCAIRCGDGRYLVHRRPEKGLLAGLWELPSRVIEDTQSSTVKTRRRDAERYVTDLVGEARSKGVKAKVKHVGDLGPVPWLFSHLRLTMHVHLFELDPDVDIEDNGSEGAQSRWCEAAVIDDESMGTGMRKCWALVREASGG
ncbi:DNA glycosylase [Annulohypoxylon bovei var. microspora]|nr:DNA glycosylase [Annulohypoxylon bovei var. microspora]